MPLFFRIITIMSVMFTLIGTAWSQTSVADTKLRILVKQVPPFVMQTEDGTLTGFSIDLWESIARQMGASSEFVMLPNLTALLEAIENGEGDAAIAAVTITAEREQQLDFSHPYFRSGLQIMIPATEMGIVARAFTIIGSMFASHSFRLALLALGILVLGTAHIMWFVERRRNPEFTRSYPLGLWDGVYWTMVTISTVGYGDKTPKSHAGRVLALVLIVFGYIAFAWFTATISSAMTVSQLEGSIRGPGDLGGKAVATVPGSTSENYLQHLPGLHLERFETIEAAYDVLEAGQLDAIVYDYPVLSYYTLGAGRAKVQLTGPVFQREPYGIVFAKGSPMREQVNQALLHVIESGEFERLHLKWFATAPN